MVNLKITLPDGFLDEEVRCGYTVTHEMKEVWAVELDIMMEIFRVCNKYKIQVLANSGTVLGAVRHKGFIPWDDDIDLEMTRENYNKLCEVGPSEFKYPYFFQTEYTDHGTQRGHIQVRRSDTTAILAGEKKLHCKFNQGIFVDIFPYDNVPDNPEAREKYLTRVKHCKRMAMLLHNYANKYLVSETEKSLKRTFLRMAYPLFAIACKVKLDTFFYRKMETAAASWNHVKTEFMGPITYNPYDDREYRRAASFDRTVSLPFEFVTVPVCANYEEILKRDYGDYMEFVIGSSEHGGVEFDTDKPYTEYTGDYYESI